MGELNGVITKDAPPLDPLTRAGRGDNGLVCPFGVRRDEDKCDGKEVFGGLANYMRSKADIINSVLF